MRTYVYKSPTQLANKCGWRSRLFCGVFQCMEQWLWKRQTCPTCRVHVSVIKPLYWSSSRTTVPWRPLHSHVHPCDLPAPETSSTSQLPLPSAWSPTSRLSSRLGAARILQLAGRLCRWAMRSEEPTFRENLRPNWSVWTAHSKTKGHTKRTQLQTKGSLFVCIMLAETNSYERGQFTKVLPQFVIKVDSKNCWLVEKQYNLGNFDVSVLHMPKNDWSMTGLICHNSILSVGFN